MSERFRAMDRDTAYLLPPSVQDWLPEQHLARFVVEMDAGQHGLESEAALQSLPTALIADRRPGSQIPSPVENTPLRTPCAGLEMSNHSRSWRFFTESPCKGSIVDSSTLNGCFQVRQAARYWRQ